MLIFSRHGAVWATAAALILQNKCLLWLQLQGAASCVWHTVLWRVAVLQSVSTRTNVNPSYTVIQSSYSYWSSWGQWRQTTFFRDCVTVMTVTKMALHWHSEFKWWQIDNAVDIDENTKQVLTYDKHDICKATLTTDGENRPVMASGGACYPCL